jgi:hypothetical protein
VRLRLLLPRRGGGGSLRGLSRGRLAAAAVALAAAAAALVLVLRGGGAPAPPPPAPPPARTPAPTPAPATAPTPLDAAAPESLAVGITEPNPNFVTPEPRGEPWARWRDALAALRPAVYRLVVDWSALQPDPAAPPDLDHFETGCLRATPPCGAWQGVRAQLRALAERQREGGWTALVVLTGTPAWAAAAPGGCERPGTSPRSRPPAPAALPAYRRLVTDVLAVAAEEGADLRYWSAWNEPNLQYFLSPQRLACDTASPTLAPAPYVAMARALQGALAAAPSDQELVLGELSGLTRPSRWGTAVGEFVRRLPRALVCSSPVWSQHAYVGGPDPVDSAARALARFGCPRRHVVWITETGVGPAPRGFSAARGIAGEVAACRALHDRLERWWRDPRVPLAVQYTLREDDRFRTGLVTTDLTRARPALAEWTAWGGTRAPADPPPPSACPAT